jgi:DNA-directed RNA polymerase sigma subunit (sigma70/sigma32)
VSDHADTWAVEYLGRAEASQTMASDESKRQAALAANGNQEAQAALVTAYRRLVVAVAKLYLDEEQRRLYRLEDTLSPPPPRSKSLRELLELGESGLWKAIDQYNAVQNAARQHDPNYDLTFETYAKWEIRNSIALGATD